MAWYLRSIGDRDTNRGTLPHPDGTVTAAAQVPGDAGAFTATVTCRGDWRPADAAR